MLHGWCHVKCCRFGASSVYTIQPYTRLQCHFIQSHIGKVYACLAVTCHLHFWQNDRDLLRATAVRNNGGGTDTKIRVSTESWLWRRKLSRRSCRDSNPRPFNHESGALTTKLSHFPDASILVSPVKWQTAIVCLFVRYVLCECNSAFYETLFVLSNNK